MLERTFRLAENGTTVRTEVLAGVTTFLTMAYIVVVQPTVLGAAGMDFGAVLVATCLASALGTLLMGLMANYPIALAPGMGHNFFFAYTVVLGMQVPWQVALGGVAVAGLIFIATAGFGLRERVIVAIPASLKHAIGVGIGLLVALLGLQWGGLVVGTPGTLVKLGSFASAPALLTVLGLAVTAVLLARGVRGALLAGIVVSTLVALPAGLVTFQGVFSRPPSLAPTLLALDIPGVFQPAMAPVVFVFFFLALFDSIGTLVGVAGQAGLMQNGVLPRAREALLADAIGTVAGATLGTSTVTAYIESSTGVAAGGRTGLASVVTAVLLLLSMFAFPLVRMVSGGVTGAGGTTLYPIVAPALILVGAMMVPAVRLIPWDDPTEAIPAFLTLLVMPLSVSITDGIAFGCISYALLKAASGRAASVHWLLYVFAFLFLLRYAWISA